MNIFGEVNLQGNPILNGRFEVLDDFPLVPKIGTWAFLHSQLMVCTEIDDVPVWLPMTPKKNTYVHKQTEESVTWEVQHKFNRDTVLVQCFDADGYVINPSKVSYVDKDNLLLTFPDPISGSVIVMFGYTEGANVVGSFVKTEGDIPLGAVFYVYDKRMIREDCLPLMGQTISEDFYPDFVKKFGGGSDVVGLIDARALFIRNLDQGRGKDSGRVNRSVQSQSLQVHKHTGSIGNKDLGNKSSTSSTSHTHGFGSPWESHKQNRGSSIALRWSDWRTQTQYGLTTSRIGTHTHTTALGAHNHSVTVSHKGGAETRPENIALILVVKVRY